VVRVSRPKEIPHEQIELPNVHVYETPALEDPRHLAEFQPVGNRGRPIGIASTTAEGRVQVEFQGKLRLTTLGTHERYGRRAAERPERRRIVW